MKLLGCFRPHPGYEHGLRSWLIWLYIPTTFFSVKVVELIPHTVHMPVKLRRVALPSGLLIISWTTLLGIFETLHGPHLNDPTSMLRGWAAKKGEGKDKQFRRWCGSRRSVNVFVLYVSTQRSEVFFVHWPDSCLGQGILIELRHKMYHDLERNGYLLRTVDQSLAKWKVRPRFYRKIFCHFFKITWRLKLMQVLPSHTNVLLLGNCVVSV